MIFKLFLLILLLILIPLKQLYAQETLSWQDCIVEAQKNNPDLIVAQEDINLEKAAKDVTKSGLYPQISASASASTAKTTTTSTSGAKSSSTSDSYSAGISGSQLIFDGLKSVNDTKAANFNIEAAKESYRFTSAQLRLDLRNAFIDLLKAQELINVVQDILKIRRDNLVLISLQYQSGLEHKGAHLTAEANLAEADYELLQAKRNLEFTQRQLSKEMGRKEFKPVLVKGEFNTKELLSQAPDFEELTANNPSVLQAILEKNSKLFSLKSSYGNFWPEITATGNANKKSFHWPPEDDQWNLGLSLNLPLFEGGLNTAKLTQARVSYNQALANEQSTRDSVKLALQQAWMDLQDSIAIVDVQSKMLQAALERSKIAETQYSTGFISFDNWIIIEDDLVRVKKSYLDAQANALIAEANWIRAKGETLEYAP